MIQLMEILLPISIKLAKNGAIYRLQFQYSYVERKSK